MPAYGRALDHGNGCFASLAGVPVEGYEIHVGRTRTHTAHRPFLELTDGPEGSVATGIPVAGTHLHGLLERPEPRHALLHALAARRGLEWRPGGSLMSEPYAMLADVVEASVRLDGLRASLLAALRAA